MRWPAARSPCTQATDRSSQSSRWPPSPSRTSRWARPARRTAPRRRPAARPGPPRRRRRWVVDRRTRRRDAHPPRRRPSSAALVILTRLHYIEKDEKVNPRTAEIVEQLTSSTSARQPSLSTCLATPATRGSPPTRRREQPPRARPRARRGCAPTSRTSPTTTPTTLATTRGTSRDHHERTQPPDPRDRVVHRDQGTSPLRGVRQRRPA